MTVDDVFFSLARKALDGDPHALIRLIGSVRANVCGDVAPDRAASLEARVRDLEIKTSHSFFPNPTHCADCWQRRYQEQAHTAHNCPDCGRELRRAPR